MQEIGAIRQTVQQQGQELTQRIQQNNIQTAQQPQQPELTADQVLAHIINPTYKKEETNNA